MAEQDVLEQELAPEQGLAPEQQMLADELTGIAQLAIGSPKRHSTTPAVSDFTGITNNTTFLASLLRWHACGIVNGLVPNDQGPTGVQNWGLTLVGQLFQQYNVNISSLSPATALHGTAQITVTVNGSGFKSTDVVQAAGVTLATTYVSPTQLTALYTPPAAAGSVPFTVYRAQPPSSPITTAPSTFTVT